MPPLWRARHHTAAQGTHAHEGHLQVSYSLSLLILLESQVIDLGIS